jgi:hypothetical protein
MVAKIFNICYIFRKNPAGSAIMRRSYLMLAVVFIAFVGKVAAVTIETAQFKEIMKYVTPETLVALDIDDTLLLPVQTLGNDAWFQYRVKQLQAEFASPAEAFERALADWEAVRHQTKVKLVEEDTAAIVEQLQGRGLIVMGLTTQGLSLATRTIQQLLSLGIDLAKVAPSRSDHYFDNGLGVLYRKGILFTSGTPKGEALFKILELCHLQPKHILFINDKLSHLKEVEVTADKRGVPFTGLRYSYGDERVKSFRKDLADIQWENSTFGHIMSDFEAECLLLAPKHAGVAVGK